MAMGMLPQRRRPKTRPASCSGWSAPGAWWRSANRFPSSLSATRWWPSTACALALHHGRQPLRRAQAAAPEPRAGGDDPVAFLTAFYSLHTLGQMQRGERVLIHSGTGGVGLAAVQLALQAGATVFATAGSTEKRELLAALGVPHVMDSRRLAFADEVLKLTRGEGVDSC